VCSRETGETTTNDDDLRHGFDTAGRGKGELGENPGQRHRVLYRRSISGTCDCPHLSRPARFQRRTAEQPSMRRQIPTCSDSEPRAAGFTFWTRSAPAFSGSSLGLQVDANRSRIMGNEQRVTPDTSKPQECIVCRNNLPKSRFVSTLAVQGAGQSAGKGRLIANMSCSRPHSLPLHALVTKTLSAMHVSRGTSKPESMPKAQLM
jgi:hypothetical protein